MLVMAAAAKRDIVDNRVKLLTDLGLQPDFIGLNPVALSNIFYSFYKSNEEKDKNKAVAILDVGSSVSNLTIILNGTPRFTRDIFIGSNEFTKRISNALGVSMDEAEAIKKNPKDKLEKVISSCELVIASIVQELKLSFDYFVTEKNVETEKLLVTGGGAKLIGFTDVLEKSLGIDAKQWSPVDYMQIGSDLSEKDINEISYKMGVAAGLALYNYAGN